MKDVKPLTDQELADLQSDYKPIAAEWRICEEEFQRRRGMPAARRARIAIGISIVALALSAFSIWLTYSK